MAAVRAIGHHESQAGILSTLRLIPQAPDMLEETDGAQTPIDPMETTDGPQTPTDPIETTDGEQETDISGALSLTPSDAFLSELNAFPVNDLNYLIMLQLILMRIIQNSPSPLLPG